MMENATEGLPSNNLYISELPPDCTEQMLHDIFGQGVHSCKVLPSKTPGMGSCVGLVRFNTVEEASKIREQLDGAMLPNLAKPLRIRFNATGGTTGSFGPKIGPYGSGSGKGDWGKGAPKGGQASQGSMLRSADTLYVKHLPPGIDDAFVKALFGAFGTIQSCKVMVQADAASCHALVQFTSHEEAMKVKQTANGATVEGTSLPISIDFAVQKQDAAASGTGIALLMPVAGMPGSIPLGAVIGQYKGGKDGKGKGKWGKDKGKGKWGGNVNIGTDQLLQGIYDLNCLPGQTLDRSENALCVSGLPKDCTVCDVYQLFAPFGALRPEGISMDSTENEVKAEVLYVDSDPVRMAEEALHGFNWGGSQLLTVHPKGHPPKENTDEKGQFYGQESKVSAAQWNNLERGARTMEFTKYERELLMGDDVGRFEGRIKTFSESNWYGFIVSPGVNEAGYPGDVWLSGEIKKNARVGQTVMFNCVIVRNKPQAKDVEVKEDMAAITDS